jgi:hypothetical protein
VGLQKYPETKRKIGAFEIKGLCRNKNRRFTHRDGRGKSGMGINFANQGGTIAGNTRKEIEEKTGKKVVSKMSAK